MDPFTDYRRHVGADPDRYYKATLFRTSRLLLGLNCLEPGQIQSAHAHPDQDKFYFVVEGEGEFSLAGEPRRAGPGAVVWAAAGSQHSVANPGRHRLVLLVGIAPAP